MPLAACAAEREIHSMAETPMAADGRRGSGAPPPASGRARTHRLRLAGSKRSRGRAARATVAKIRAAVFYSCSNRRPGRDREETGRDGEESDMLEAWTWIDRG